MLSKKRFLAFWGGFATIGIIAEALILTYLRGLFSELLGLSMPNELGILFIVSVTLVMLFGTAVAALIATVWSMLFD